MLFCVARFIYINKNNSCWCHWTNTFLSLPVLRIQYGNMFTCKDFNITDKKYLFLVVLVTRIWYWATERSLIDDGGRFLQNYKQRDVLFSWLMAYFTIKFCVFMLFPHNSVVYKLSISKTRFPFFHRNPSNPSHQILLACFWRKIAIPMLVMLHFISLSQTKSN